MDLEGVSSLFTPYRVRNIFLKNRFVVPGMQRGVSDRGMPTPALTAYYRRFIEGGFAMVMSESCAIDHPVASAKTSVLRMNADTKSGWRRCVEEVREVGGCILIQLWHEGAMRECEDPALPSLSPSGLRTGTKPSGRALTGSELAALKESYTTAAQRAQEIGAAGVEVHAGHGYLLDQFLWPDTNRRTDGYGGPDIRQRVRFAAEVVAAIRHATGNDFIISFRFSQWKVSYDGTVPTIHTDAKVVHSPEDLQLMLTSLRENGVDLFHASTRTFYQPEWPNDDRSLAGWARGFTDAGVITVGGVGRNSDGAEVLAGEQRSAPMRLESNLVELARRFRRGDFDLVSVGRASIGDPEWANKVRSGRYQDITPFSPSELLALRSQIT
jgi:2,4-dienoyl-CoA reductase-like NADH-dependent reductase (Old Yellow Enzyme family)